MKPLPAARTLVTAVAVFACVAAAALDDGAAPTPRVVETARVNLVNVEASVTGTDGLPVRGLRREDFELFEDGKPVEVTNFAALGPPEAPAAAPTPATADAAAPSPARETAPPAEEMLSLVVYVDNANISLTRRNEVFAQLRTLIAGVVAGGRAQVMMVSGGGSVRIRQTFTGNPAELAAALDVLEHEAAEGGASGADAALTSRVMDRTSMNEDEGGTGPGARSGNPVGDVVNSLLVQARSAAEAEYERTRSILKVMTQFVSSLGGLPGRKVMFYVGKGISLRPGEELLQKFEALYGNSGVAPGFSSAMETSHFNLTEPLRDLVRAANAGRVTISCVEAGGGGGRGASAEQSSMTANPGIQTGGELGLRQSLDTMAGATGGQTITSGAGLGAALGRSIANLGVYYSLGYTPAHGNDGAYHTLKVRVRRDGATVRAREGYLDWTSDDRMAAASLAGVLFNLASNPIGAALSVKPEGQDKSGTFAVTVMVAVPLEKLVLHPQGPAHEASVSLWFASIDPDNRVSQAKKQVFPIRIPNEKLLTALGQAAGYAFRLNLHPGAHRVAVSLRDDFGETEGTVTTAFSVGDQPAAPGAS